VTTWLVILAVGLGSYVLRALPTVLGERWTGAPAFERAVAHAGTAAIAALIAGSVRRDAADAGALAMTVAALLVAAVVAWRGASLPRVLLAGGATYGSLVALIAVAGLGG
jgi:branched-subunit amino acid transport protein